MLQLRSHLGHDRLVLLWCCRLLDLLLVARLLWLTRVVSAVCGRLSDIERARHLLLALDQQVDITFLLHNEISTWHGHCLEEGPELCQERSEGV